MFSVRACGFTVFRVALALLFHGKLKHTTVPTESFNKNTHDKKKKGRRGRKDMRAEKGNLQRKSEQHSESHKQKMQNGKLLTTKSAF